MAREGRPAIIAAPDRLTAIDPSPKRAALPAGHAITWSAVLASTPCLQGTEYSPPARLSRTVKPSFRSDTPLTPT